MNGFPRMGLLTLLGVGLLAGFAYAETIELVTYYPANVSAGDAEFERLHVRTGVTVGPPYSLTSPAGLTAGTLLVADAIGIGPGFTATATAGALHVVGTDGGPDRAVFLAGAGGTMSVGIGTAAPTMPLEVYLQDESYVRVWGTGINAQPENFSGIELGSDLPADGVIDRIWQLAHKRGGAGGLNDFQIAYRDAAGNWNPRVTIQPGGNVGIGTTTPASKLTILQGSDSQAMGTAGLRLINMAQTAVTQIFTGGDNGSYFFNGTGYNFMVLSSAGNVGIGVTSPQSRLHVAGNAVTTLRLGGVETGIDFEANNTLKWFVFAADSGNFYIHDRVNGVNRISVAANGNVGIGRDLNTASFTLQVDGSAGKPGGGAWSDSSDVRLKKNIGPLTGALERMLALRGVAFEWKNPASHGDLTGKQMGMIGQEVAKVFPEWVSEDSAGMKLLSIRGFEALTVEAVRELKAENTLLDRKNKELEERVRRLEQRIVALP